MKQKHDGKGSDVAKRPAISWQPFTRKSLPRGGELITFQGTSGTRNPKTRSVVPCAIYKSSLSLAQLEKMRKLVVAFKDASSWVSIPMSQDRPDYKQEEVFFRMSDQVPPIKTHGANFKNLAPQDCCKWWKQLAGNNEAFYSALETSCSKLMYETNQGKKPAFLAKRPFKNKLFSYVALQQRTWPKKGGTRSLRHQTSTRILRGGWHADGGPSSIFLAITVAGKRILNIEDADGNRCRIPLAPGDFYVSQPSGFWHNVEYSSGAQPSLSLIVRSSVLVRRLSGGRQKTDGKRTGGMINATKACFETMSGRVHDCIVNMAIENGFRAT